MRTAFRKISSLLLLVIALAPAFYFFSAQLAQQHIRHKMFEELEQHSLHTITLNQNDFHWTRDKKEISIENRLFDIKSVHHNADGTVTVTGLYDKEETALLFEVEKNQEKNREEGNSQVIAFLQILISAPGTETELFVPVINNVAARFVPSHESLSCAYIEIVTPPPQA